MVVYVGHYTRKTNVVSHTRKGPPGPKSRVHIRKSAKIVANTVIKTRYQKVKKFRQQALVIRRKNDRARHSNFVVPHAYAGPLMAALHKEKQKQKL